MNWIDKYSFVRHTPGGRVFPNLDCWGLVRCILAERKGIELPEFCDFSQKNMGDPASGMIAQHVFQEIAAPEDYCVICYYRHGILFHVGVFYQGDILHTTNWHGFRKQPLESFYPQCMRRFYRYAGQDIHPPVSDMADRADKHSEFFRHRERSFSP